MIQLKEINNAVYAANESLVHLGQAEVRYLKDRVMQSERKRIRICTHKNGDALLQEMFIAVARESYIRPSKHVHKEESMHVIEGLANLVFFDETGHITKAIEMGDRSSGRSFYCRTPESIYHTLLIHSDLLVYHESTQGPFRRTDTFFPSWAPDERDGIAVRAYLERLSVEVDRFQHSKNIFGIPK